MTAKDFVEYSSKAGASALPKREEREAMKRNGDMGPHELWRCLPSEEITGELGVHAYGETNREVIDGQLENKDIPRFCFS